jgi:hypothetical protein
MVLACCHRSVESGNAGNSDDFQSIPITFVKNDEMATENHNGAEIRAAVGCQGQTWRTGRFVPPWLGAERPLMTIDENKKTQKNRKHSS